VTVLNEVANYFGSKKGLLRFFTYEFLRKLGLYTKFRKVDFTKVERLVFVCQGNICRSPLGEAVARHYQIPSISFGLDTRGGDSADPRAIKWAAQNGYDLTEHKTMRVDQYELKAGDLLIGMEPKHTRKLVRRFSEQPVQITLIGLWLETPEAYLHDPYNTNETYFNHCEQRVFDAAQALIKNHISAQKR
jgi:protein-tyrosine phosphatase